ncbi:MAG: putative membrane protein [Cyclobacteriaceae bacterium]|jgi:uncharacterized membrane protein
MTGTTKYRLESIDIIRGLVMVIMVLDHMRDYFHIGANLDDPLNLDTTTYFLFFTRWITHYCAPVFVLLSGTSIYLQSLRKSKNELGLFLIKRGIWLICLELFVVSFAWTFNPQYNIIPFQVIWAIGISMFILGILVMIRLSDKLILLIGIILVAGHNLMDIPESSPDFQSTFWWDMIHHGVFALYPFAQNHSILLVYPFAAWTGVMILGYSAGKIFSSSYSSPKRQKILKQTGFALITIFILLRFSNIYGDPAKWSIQNTWSYTLLSFIKITKYPPSLLYLCITLGPTSILLALAENWKNRYTDMLIVFGRTALFFYIIHLYLIHFLAAISFFITGHTWEQVSMEGAKYPFLFVVPGEGYGLGVVYLLSIVVVIGLYPLCRWYNSYKINNKEKWWLSYL